MAEILAEVAARHCLPIAALTGRRMTRDVAWARQEAMWEMRTRTRHSTVVIGNLFNRDHTTVMHGVKAHEARITRLTEGRNERSVRERSNED